MDSDKGILSIYIYIYIYNSYVNKDYSNTWKWKNRDNEWSLEKKILH